MMLARAAGVLSRRTLDGVVLLQIDGGDAVLVTGPGATVWSILEVGPASQQTLIAALAAAYGMPSTTVATDIRGLVDHLKNLGMVVEQPAQEANMSPA